MKGQFSYAIVPKFSQNAYLKSNFTNNSEYPFLPGKMNIFMDNNFVSHNNMPVCIILLFHLIFSQLVDLSVLHAYSLFIILIFYFFFYSMFQRERYSTHI